MNIKITGKELKATDSIKEYVERKIERLEKYFGEDIDVLATIKTEGNEQVAELHVTAAGETFRAVTAHRDLYASIDKDIDILEGQIRKMKTKKEKQNMSDSIKLKETLNTDKPQNEIEDEIIKTIYYSIKPMAPEDAKLELEGKPKNNFLAFINIETGKVNVIYRLKDSKNFGLVEPEA
ncbi:MAG: ribosome-associated translation inhibitor RaiA [Clostridia bacterium]|nr:ribosome-associated translation inhibitor RaiA [Clostridia bacterium]